MKQTVLILILALSLAVSADEAPSKAKQGGAAKARFSRARRGLSPSAPCHAVDSVNTICEIFAYLSSIEYGDKTDVCY